MSICTLCNCCRSVTVGISACISVNWGRSCASCLLLTLFSINLPVELAFFFFFVEFNGLHESLKSLLRGCNFCSIDAKCPYSGVSVAPINYERSANAARLTAISSDC
jgi:hypothetical protein